MSPAARDRAALAALSAAMWEGLLTGISQGGDPGAQLQAARRQGQIVCPFDHAMLDPATPGGAFARCPHCWAAL
ncbi:hypothetical protein CA850_29670 [Micromonospora echinospora]|uniref:Uncharacterized protein n=1 Tax=Micromonospora echinospora TaxID=1877 RepID=A0A1C5AB90_MICEC|nr:hypothetical protein [Micromonospora echinospora]OZV74749.1 hypothetical protein CA850_29670 [Micromonospora echinospora]SCF42480.1 hypothetical protein GA0070618_6666 [Micromonospora echinospora]